MVDKENKKKLKKIQKEIHKLRRDLKKTEYRPCQSDAELRQKDEDIRMIRDKILALENEKDRYMLNTGGIRHGI